MTTKRMIGLRATGCLALAVALFGSPADARDYLKSEFSQQRGFSDAVVTEGGRPIPELV